MTDTQSRPPLVVVAGSAEERFRVLYAAYFRDLLGYALRRVAAPEDAADVVAETMLVAWRRIGEVPDDSGARLWLYGVARRVLANHHRGLTRRDRLGERLRQHLVAAAPDIAESVTAVTAVRDALARLGEDDRELIGLTGWEGLTPQEAAAVLGLAPGTVRARLHRARARLRAELGDDPGQAGHVRVIKPVQEEER
jgi:RNA polymerase sigma-70 factor, ECF subfamily